MHKALELGEISFNVAEAGERNEQVILTQIERANRVVSGAVRGINAEYAQFNFLDAAGETVSVDPKRAHLGDRL